MDHRAYYEVLRTTSLMRGMTDTELDTVLTCFSPRTQRYRRGEILLMAGYQTAEIGIVLEGGITAVKHTPAGGSVVITQMGPGGLFGDVLAGSNAQSPVIVQADGDCLILYLPHAALLRPCGALHEAHWKLLQNLVQTISNKYFALDRRLEMLICRSLRARISMWLLDEARRAGADTFTVPLTRAGLAEYLNCDRSALSRELGRMQREGLIETWRGSFKILDKEGLRKRSRED